MTTRLFQVDAFSDTPFAGNPAAVCLLDSPRPETWMQAVAAEMNLSETAFVVPRAEEGHWDLRWFTPTVEVRLCGHATLATAHVVWQEQRAAPAATLCFHTLSGELRARRGPGSLIELDFPSQPPEPLEAPAGLDVALGSELIEVARSSDDLLVRLADEACVRGLTPDFKALGRLPFRGIIVTALASSPELDFVSRFFGPAVGVDEDPVTGSAHCRLAPYWARELGRSELVGFQASARGGTVTMKLMGDRVILGGHAVTVLEGHLLSD